MAAESEKWCVIRGYANYPPSRIMTLVVMTLETPLIPPNYGADHLAMIPHPGLYVGNPRGQLRILEIHRCSH